MDKKLESLTKRIDKLKSELVELGAMRPGSLSEQYNVCGSPGCKCKADPPTKHGPYHQLSFTFKGRSRSEFVRKENLQVVKRQLANYAKYKKLTDEWVELELERSREALASSKKSG